MSASSYNQSPEYKILEIGKNDTVGTFVKIMIRIGTQRRRRVIPWKIFNEYFEPSNGRSRGISEWTHVYQDYIYVNIRMVKDRFSFEEFLLTEFKKKEEKALINLRK